MRPSVAAELERDFQTMLEIEQKALAILSAARHAADCQDEAGVEETLLRVIALRLIEQAMSVWQETTGEPITLQKVAALIPYRPEHWLPPHPKPAPEL